MQEDTGDWMNGLTSKQVGRLLDKADGRTDG